MKLRGRAQMQLGLGMRRGGVGGRAEAAGDGSKLSLLVSMVPGVGCGLEGSH